MAFQQQSNSEQDGRFVFLGGHLAIDLGNTLMLAHGQPVDALGGWPDLIGWFHRAGIATDPGSKVPAAHRDAAMKQVLELRRVWRQTLAGIIKGEAPGERFISYLNGLVAKATFAETLRRLDDGTYRLVRSNLPLNEPHHAAGFLATQIASFLAEADFSRIRRCANTESCVLFFYDDTKNHRRQWCSAATCGNRHKMAAFRERQKATSKKTIRKR
jgi:predicted RNA-binding Zn ribbon-like protein